MYASQLLSELIQVIAREGDVNVVMDPVSTYGTEVRSVWMSPSGELHIEPVDH